MCIRVRPPPGRLGRAEYHKCGAQNEPEAQELAGSLPRVLQAGEHFVTSGLVGGRPFECLGNSEVSRKLFDAADVAKSVLVPKVALVVKT